MSTEDSFSFRVVDTLVNAPSSVAGIYADLVYLLGMDAHQVLESLRRSLDALEQRGWVLARLQAEDGNLKSASEEDKRRSWNQYVGWLPSAARDELAVDEVGLWYGITEAGRAAWNAWAGESHEALWQLDEDATKRLVSVVAENEEAAERRLAEWFSERGGFMPCTKEVSPVADVQLRSGRVLARGVRLTCSYTEQSGRMPT